MGTGKLLGKPKKLGEVICDGLASRPGEVEILLAASCYRNRDKLRQLWAIFGSKASLLLFFVTEQVYWFIPISQNLSHVTRTSRNTNDLMKPKEVLVLFTDLLTNELTAPVVNSMV